MLSRAASNLFWMGRYIERAENIVSILDSNLSCLRNSETYEAVELSHRWREIINALGLEEEFSFALKADPSLTTFDFLISGKENPSSLFNCIDLARENARMVRYRITDLMWIEINSLYLKKNKVRSAEQFSPEEFFSEVISFSFLFQGLCDSTLSYGEGHSFYMLGRYMERADKTSRILDIPHYSDDDSQHNQWSEVLNATWSRRSYISEYGTTPKEESVQSFLLFSEVFPRSVRFCLHRIQKTLENISRSRVRRRYANESERLAGASLASIDFEGEALLEEHGLHEYIDSIQSSINQIGQAVFEDYFLLAVDLDTTPVVALDGVRYSSQ